MHVKISKHKNKETFSIQNGKFYLSYITDDIALTIFNKLMHKIWNNYVFKNQYYLHPNCPFSFIYKIYPV